MCFDESNIKAPEPRPLKTTASGEGLGGRRRGCDEAGFITYSSSVNMAPSRPLVFLGVFLRYLVNRWCQQTSILDEKTSHQRFSISALA